MLKKTITYKDYNGTERTEDFYFNLNKMELTEMELSVEGGLSQKCQKILQDQDMASIVKTFKDIILRSYGEKSEDGKRFVKSKELSLSFSQTEAFNVLFTELATNEKAANDFIKSVIPHDINVNENSKPQKKNFDKSKRK